jgi:anti-anti-sigma factor
MLDLHITKNEDVAIIRCKGRIVRSAAAFALRDAVTEQRDARVVLLDLSEVESLEGGGLGMLVFLQRWTRDNGIRFRLFGPSNPVRKSLERAGSTSQFDITALPEMFTPHTSEALHG